MLGGYDESLSGIDPERALFYQICEENDVGITVMKGFFGGRLFDPERSPFGTAFTSPQLIHYALTRPGVKAVMCGYDTKEQVFRSQAIRNEEELWASVPEVLSCGFEASETSTIYRYLESTRSVDFTNHFLVSVQERDTERLEQYGAVNVFRTTE